jgi:hypothetical protein
MGRLRRGGTRKQQEGLLRTGHHRSLSSSRKRTIETSTGHYKICTTYSVLPGSPASSTSEHLVTFTRLSFIRGLQCETPSLTYSALDTRPSPSSIRIPFLYGDFSPRISSPRCSLDLRRLPTAWRQDGDKESGCRIIFERCSSLLEWHHWILDLRATPFTFPILAALIQPREAKGSLIDSGRTIRRVWFWGRVATVKR